MRGVERSRKRAFSGVLTATLNQKAATLCWIPLLISAILQDLQLSPAPIALLPSVQSWQARCQEQAGTASSDWDNKQYTEFYVITPQALIQRRTHTHCPTTSTLWTQQGAQTYSSISVYAALDKWHLLMNCYG